jgi:hypothetical protein
MYTLTFNLINEKVWQLPGVLFEMGQIYEAYGAFEGALAVYQHIVTTLSFYPKYTEVSMHEHLTCF